MNIIQLLIILIIVLLVLGIIGFYKLIKSQMKKRWKNRK